MIPVGSIYTETQWGNLTLYDVDLTFQYPASTENKNLPEAHWLENLLSRNSSRINKAQQEIISYYKIPSHGVYKKYNRWLRKLLMTLEFFERSTKNLKLTYHS